MKNFKSEGNVVTFTAPANGVQSGVPVIVGGLFLIPAYDAAEGESCEGAKNGVFSIAKLSTDTPTSGDIAYWDNTAKHVTTSSDPARYEIGVFAETLGAGTTVADVNLNGVAVVAISASQPATGNTVPHTFAQDTESEVVNGVFYHYAAAGRATVRGVVAGTKVNDKVVAQGDIAYWDATAKKFTPTQATGLFKVGVFAEAALKTATECYVNLLGVFLEAED